MCFIGDGLKHANHCDGPYIFFFMSTLSRMSKQCDELVMEVLYVGRPRGTEGLEVVAKGSTGCAVKF